MESKVKYGQCELMGNGIIKCRYDIFNTKHIVKVSKAPSCEYLMIHDINNNKNKYSLSYHNKTMECLSDFDLFAKSMSENPTAVKIIPNPLEVKIIPNPSTYK